MTKKNLKLNEPFTLIPAGIEKLWGGSRLKKDFHKKSKADPLGESWECSTHPEGLSIIGSGELRGFSLAEIIDKYPEILGTKLEKNKELPILIKLIDSNQQLSVQVHPNDDYAQLVENSKGKSEMWYVLDAQKDSKLIYGLHHEISKEKLLESLNNDSIEKYLQYINVKKGDVFYLEPGTIHGIGAGIILAEIQQNSNITYRLYDYNRLDKYGNKRNLHIKKALDIVSLKASKEPRQPMRILKYSTGIASESLCSCKYFQVERLLFSSKNRDRPVVISTQESSFEVFLCVEGEGYWSFGDNKNLFIRKGDSLFVPSKSCDIKVFGKFEFLKVIC